MLTIIHSSLVSYIPRKKQDKAGWWVLIVFVPVIGGFWYLVECGFLRGIERPNNYDPDPLHGIRAGLVALAE